MVAAAPFGRRTIGWITTSPPVGVVTTFGGSHASPSVGVRVGLVRIQYEGTVVGGIRHTVIIVVGVASIAENVISIRLVFIKYVRAIVINVRHRIAIVFRVASVNKRIAV